VSFGKQWVRESALEIFREDIARFRVLLGAEIDEDAFEELAHDRVPELKALRLHNGTIYRWMRPCYGISDGKPHLRIENRILPSGPTVRDEVANAAFWFGLMSGVSRRWEDITRVFDFSLAKENFIAAARLGLGSQLEWPGRGSLPAEELILDELLPLARSGLEANQIDGDSIDLYLGTIEERVRSGRTGAQWIVDSSAALESHGSRAERLAALVAATVKRQRDDEPVHRWRLATLEEAGSWPDHYRTVGQIMTTDLFTVGEDELVDLVAAVMDWGHIRHVPVEDNRHRLVGLVTHRSLVRLVAKNMDESCGEPIPVRQIMLREVLTARPDTLTLDAIRLMRQHRIGCLPVVDSDRLVGIVTERDFMNMSAALLEQVLEGAVRVAPRSNEPDEAPAAETSPGAEGEEPGET
jgi:CBS domain-containing protein